MQLALRTGPVGTFGQASRCPLSGKRQRNVDLQLQRHVSIQPGVVAAAARVDAAADDRSSGAASISGSAHAPPSGGLYMHLQALSSEAVAHLPLTQNPVIHGRGHSNGGRGHSNSSNGYPPGVTDVGTLELGASLESSLDALEASIQEGRRAATAAGADDGTDARQADGGPEHERRPRRWRQVMDGAASPASEEQARQVPPPGPPPPEAGTSGRGAPASGRRGPSGQRRKGHAQALLARAQELEGSGWSPETFLEALLRRTLSAPIAAPAPPPPAPPPPPSAPWRRAPPPPGPNPAAWRGAPGGAPPAAAPWRSAPPPGPNAAAWRPAQLASTPGVGVSAATAAAPRSGGGAALATAPPPEAGAAPSAPALNATGSLPNATLDSLPSLTSPEAARLFADLARAGNLLAALQVLEAVAQAGRAEALARFSHKHFLHAAADARKPRAALRFLQLLPAQFADVRTYNMALRVCVRSADLQAAQSVLDMMALRQVQPDHIHITTIITVCGATGDMVHAFKAYADARSRALPLDGVAYGALLSAVAAAINRARSDRKEQLVLLQRAMDVLGDATAAGIHLEPPAWNALLLCAGRAGQLQRAFEVLDQMQGAGSPPTEVTYCCLVEACCMAKEPGLALRVLRRAEALGLARSRHIYTAAINACMVLSEAPGGGVGGGAADGGGGGAAAGGGLRGAARDGAAASSVDGGSGSAEAGFQAALQVYSEMQRAGVEPDDLVYGSLVALAGRAGQLDTALSLVTDMREGGLSPGPATTSALIKACLASGQLRAARRAYDLLAAAAVYPSVAQYNALLEAYALRHRLGDVTSLLGDMVGPAGHAPNGNTFRVLLLACQRCDQCELAFEVYGAMKARRIVPKEKNTWSICFTLMRCCLNRIFTRTSTAAPSSSWSGIRPGEAARLLSLVHPGGAQTSRRRTFLDNAGNINWQALAHSTYREFVNAGMRPHIDVLDLLLACLRLPAAPAAPGGGGGAAAPGARGAAEPVGGTGAADGAHVTTAEILSALQRAGAAAAAKGSAKERPYEAAFERRAIELMGEAVGQALLPAYKPDAPFVVDMRNLPPTVAEVYTLWLLGTLEARGAATAAKGSKPFVHPISLLVPPFDPNYVMWPSAVEKVNLHYEALSLERAAVLRAQAEEARQASAAAAAVLRSGGSVGSSADLDSEEEEAEFNDVFAPPAPKGAAPGRLPWAPEALQEAAAFRLGALVGADHDYVAGDATALGVAATCRRLKAYARLDPGSGVLTLTPREVNRWVGARLSYMEDQRKRMLAAEEGPSPAALFSGGDVSSSNAAPASGAGGAPGGVAPPRAAPQPVRAGHPSLMEQQRSIRMGVALAGGGGGAPSGLSPGGGFAGMAGTGHRPWMPRPAGYPSASAQHANGDGVAGNAGAAAAADSAAAGHAAQRSAHDSGGGGAHGRRRSSKGSSRGGSKGSSKVNSPMHTIEEQTEGAGAARAQQAPPAV